MDLVLVCQKKSIQCDVLSQLPRDIMLRALESLGIQNNSVNENRLFLYFMGELLKTASTASEIFNYEWFENVLLHFDNFKIEVGLMKITREIKQKDKSFQQLRLLEASDDYSSEAKSE